jgi:AcrR family transcriptional regulator
LAKQGVKRSPAKAGRRLKWQRDPEGMRLRILAAAKREFASYGLAGARVDRIAAEAGANKRMLYYHVGNKEDLYLAVLEDAYEQIREEERGLHLEHLAPADAIARLISFTWAYFIRNPEFLALLNTENVERAANLKRSTKVKSMHSPLVEMIRTVVTRGVARGDFVVAMDPVQLYISIAGLCFFYLGNNATLSVIFGRDLLSDEAKRERLDHVVGLVLAALTGRAHTALSADALIGIPPSPPPLPRAAAPVTEKAARTPRAVAAKAASVPPPAARRPRRIAVTP